MTIIHKYVIKELVKYFCVALSAVIAIYLTVDFFEKIDDFLDAKVPVSRAIVFLVLKIPFIVAQVTPVGVLLAVLIVFGLMTKNNEVVALQSNGVSIYHLFKPVLVMGVVFSLFVFFFNEVLVPIAMSRASEIWHNEVNRESKVTSRRKNVWIRGKDSISHVTYFKPSDKAIFGITLNYFDDSFRLIKRLDAKKGVYKRDRWHLFDVVEQQLLEDNGRYKINYRTKVSAKLDFVPEDINKVVKRCEEMTYNELSEYIQEVEQQGYDASTHRVDLRAKMAFPFACLIMTIVGTSLAFWRKRRVGLAKNIFFGIGIALVYWTLHSLCLSLGYGGVLPPIAAAWLTNAICVGFGVFALVSVN